MKLRLLLKNVPHVEVLGSPDRDVTGVVYDSRRVRPGFAFVALKGQHEDGWAHLDEAVRRGASVIFSERGGEAAGGCALVRVSDARLSLAALAVAFYGNPSSGLCTIGITGTNGKTTTAYLIRDALRVAGRKPGLIGTVEYQIGERRIPARRTTPEAPDLQAILADMKSAGCDTVTMEVSSHALDQKRVEGIEFDVAVFTNLTRDHLDYHGGMENYFDAKTRLFSNLGGGQKSAFAVINIDDPSGKRLLGLVGAGAQKLTFAVEQEADICVRDLRLSTEGSAFLLRSPWGEAEMRIQLLGRFNVSNVLAATAVCGALDVPLHQLAESLAKTTMVPGRLEEVAGPSGVKVFVDYAHTDDALEHVLKTLREIARGKVLVVFGCGGNRDRTKRPAMGKVATRLADYCVLTSDNPRNEDPLEIIHEIEQGIEEKGKYETVPDRRRAIERLIDIAEPGDVLLIAGKGHENFQEFENRTIPFDDRQVVREIVG